MVHGAIISESGAIRFVSIKVFDREEYPTIFVVEPGELIVRTALIETISESYRKPILIINDLEAIGITIKDLFDSSKRISNIIFMSDKIMDDILNKKKSIALPQKKNPYIAEKSQPWRNKIKNKRR